MKYKGKTLFKVIVYPLVLLIILEGCLFYLAFSNSEMIKSVEHNATKTMEDHLQINTKMLDNYINWSSNLTRITEQLSKETDTYLEQKQCTLKELCGSKELSSDYLMRISDDLKNLMGDNSVTGSFFILSGDRSDIRPSKARRYNGVYFRVDKTSEEGQSDSVILERGPESVGAATGAARSESWQEDFLYNPMSDADLEYFMNPLDAAFSYSNLEMIDEGYWSDLFSLNGKTDARQIYTYSQPIWDNNHNIYGVVGIEISVEDIQKLFSEVNSIGTAENSYYLVEHDTGQSTAGVLQCQIQVPLYEKAPVNDSNIELVKTEKGEGLYKVVNLGDRSNGYYGKIVSIDLYNSNNSLFQKQMAVLVLQSEEVLFENRVNFSRSLLLALAVSLLGGALLILANVGYIRSKLRRFISYLEQIQPDEQMQVNNNTIAEFMHLQKIVNDMLEGYQQNNLSLKKDNERYLIALERSADAVFEYDCQKDVFAIYQFASEEGQLTTMQETLREEFLGSISTEGYCYKEDISAMTNFLKGRFSDQIEVRIRNSSQEPYLWMSIRGRAILDKEGNISSIIGNIREINESKQRQIEEQEKNSLDRATGLFVFEVGEKKIREYLAFKEQDEGVSLCLIDLDEFSKLNEYYGFLYGDIIIEEVGNILRRYIHDGDIGLRIGGDEFLLCLKNIDKDETLRICHSICNNIETMYVGEGDITRLTCSIGFVYRNGVVDYENLLRYAGSALFEIKTRKDSRVGEYFTLKREPDNRMDSYEFNLTKDISEIKSLEYNDNVISVAFNIFEKCVNFKSALLVLMKKIGYTYKLSSMLVVDTDLKNCTDRIVAQWRLFGFEPFSEESVTFEKTVYEEFFEMFDTRNMLLLSREAGAKVGEKLKEMLYFVGLHECILFPMYDGAEYCGYIQFKRGYDETEWSGKQIEHFRKLVNIITIQYLQYRREQNNLMIQKSYIEMEEQLKELKQEVANKK